MDPIRNIVVASDFSPLSEAAAARAATLARLDGATMHLVHALRLPLVVAPYEISVPAAVWEGVRKAADEKLETARQALASRSGQRVTARVVDSGDAVHAIGLAVREHAAELVVMGTHGRSGIPHAFLGSVAERTLRTLDCPVLAVKESVEAAARPIARILVAVDFSSHSDRAVAVAGALAARLSAAVDVVHAFELPGDFLPYATPFGMEFEEKMQRSADERLSEVRERLDAVGVRSTVHTRRGHPPDVIAELAGETGCQLIVMGTRGNTGLAHVLLGSVAERTLRTAPCSVLAVKAPPAGA